MERGELGTLDKSSDDTDRLLLPTHMKHVTSLASMEAFSDGSQSDVETRSRSSGIALDMGPTGGTPLELSPLGWDHRGGDTDSAASSSSSESSPLCSINLKEYISDLTLYSHTALMRDDEVGSGGGKKDHHHHHHHKPGELDTTSTADNNTFTSTYDKWKQLSGPMILFLVLGLVILVWGRGHLLQLLQWLEMLPLHLSMLVFIVLFTLISFPFGFGYIILNMMAGYLYGIVRGQLIVMVSVSVGMTVSFLLCRRWLKEYARTMVTSNALQAVLRVVEGPNGFKVILLTRFTPFPFGLQNVLFAVTSVSFWQFFLASVLGLLPTQILNTYMGSTVRSMQEVLTDRMDGYIILGVQVVFSVVLMLYLLTKARRELAKLTNMENKGEP